MKKKYTMEQFKEMFDEAQEKTIEELRKDFEESDAKKDNGKDILFMLHNIMVTATLRKYLFNKEEGE